jgi:hypothetical protein
MLSREAKKYQFYSLWFDPTGDQTHDLKKEITSDRVISTSLLGDCCLMPSEQFLRFI